MEILLQDNVNITVAAKSQVLMTNLSPHWQRSQAVYKKDDIIEDLKNVNVSGESIGDIPTTYTIPPLRRHEKPVVGTFVDANIVPGFKYSVRRNGTTQYLFEGNSLFLESIGQGYGKRITFESDDILNNDNFFWSDTNHKFGYAFSINVLSENDTFDVYNENDNKIGYADIISVSEGQEIMTSKSDVSRKEHTKEVQVNFKCQFHLQNDFKSDVAGVLTVTKSFKQEKATIRHIDALLLPSGKILTLKPAALVE